MLKGRAEERSEIDRLISRARSGAGGVVVIKGQVGSGKTALLDDVGRTAEGVRVLRGAGFESEAELPFAALHMLLRPVHSHIKALGGAQATALNAALEFGAERNTDHHVIRPALLSVLSALAAERPLLCLVDDAQWVDHASAEALLFTARRLGSEGIALVIAARDDDQVLAGAGLPELRLGPLDHTSAAAVVAQRDPGLVPPARDRIIAEARGNPLALSELLTALTPAQRAGRLNPYAFHHGAVAVTGPAQGFFKKALGRLPVPTRALLLLAAAVDTPELGLVLRAARRSGATLADLGAAEQARLVHVTGSTVAFSHPLIRAVAYHDVTAAERQAAHRDLAEAAGDDVNLRAWQLAAATAGPDEEVAAELERVAEHSGDQYAYAAYERAARLTADRERGTRMLAAAAAAAGRAGLLRGALELAEQVVTLTDDPSMRATAARVQAAAGFEQGAPLPAGRTLLEGAELIHAHEPAKAMLMLVEAIRCGLHAADTDLVRVARSRLGALSLPASSPLVSLSSALSAVMTPPGRTEADDPHAVLELAKAARASVPAEVAEGIMVVSLDLTVIGHGECATADALVAETLVAECREGGTTRLLPHALQVLAQAHMYRGRHGQASAAATEGLNLASKSGQFHRASQLKNVLAWLAAVEGDEDRCTALAMDGMEYATAQGMIPGIALGTWALALLDLGYTRDEEALIRLESLWSGESLIGPVRLASDHIEAAVRCGRPDQASRPLALLEKRVDGSRNPVAAAVALRCKALTSHGKQAERYYEAAMQMHEKIDQPYERARTQLAYGEWLRRIRRKSAAHNPLSAAADTFERLGAKPWAARARAELKVMSSATAPEPMSGLLGQLTPQERQVVRLAATGASNGAIGARLFLSPRTVGNHLYRAYPKLGVKSRAELGKLDLPET
ncbi:helix-turn-helix transcriptional regulator [Actinomadura alba]|uniref:AAA family ATPase n=1 Tax=Actinomadura alba TaxID=406431 RepID=A0ABR7LGT9_9ACTN|nr:helix-turn-helix transcriptional regulator [Actinomadura alba]MBC6463959.1 AAA family ATPase [Actinomadura alba]